MIYYNAQPTSVLRHSLMPACRNARGRGNRGIAIVESAHLHATICAPKDAQPTPMPAGALYLPAAPPLSLQEALQQRSAL